MVYLYGSKIYGTFCRVLFFTTAYFRTLKSESQLYSTRFKMRHGNQSAFERKIQGTFIDLILIGALFLFSGINI